MATRLLRFVVALVWIEEGLWAKLLRHSTEEVAIVEAIGARVGIAPTVLLVLIGLGEVAIGALVIAGVWQRPLAWAQIAIVVAMNAAGILYGGVRDPMSLVVHNLPFLFCVFLLTRRDADRRGRDAERGGQS